MSSVLEKHILDLFQYFKTVIDIGFSYRLN